MRFILALFAALIFFAAAPDETFAQSKTIILARHVERDASATADPNDPGLSDAGRERAQRLARRIKGYRPGEIYATSYRRTRETADPMAKRRKKEVKTYDPRNQKTLVDEIMKSPTKRFFIVGHSNTVPGLANLLIKKELFKNLEETEYGTIWVIKLREGKPAEVKVLSY